MSKFGFDRYAFRHRPSVLRVRIRHLPLRQTFKGIPKELVEAATMEGASTLQILWRVYVPLGRSYVALPWYR